MTSPAHLVRELWTVPEDDRLDAALEAAGEEVVWQPTCLLPGQVFRSTAELRRALAELLDSGLWYVPRLEALEEHDGVVLASGTLQTSMDGVTDESVIHVTYHFRDGRLTRQAMHDTRQDALDAIAVLRRLGPSFGVLEEPGLGDEKVIRLRGELDIANIADLEAVLLRARAPGERVVLDLASLRFMDSTGLRVVMRACAAARDGRWDLRLRNVPPNVNRLFTLSGVHDLLPFELPD